MLRLELTKANGTLQEFKPKTKKDEGGKRPCAELTISVTVDYHVLAFFGSEVRDAMFNMSAAHDLAGGPTLRDPGKVYPEERKEEMGGVTVKLGVGIGAPMEFADAHIDYIRITPVGGGPVILVFRVRCLPTEKQAGQLYMLQESSVEVTLEPRDSPELREVA